MGGTVSRHHVLAIDQGTSNTKVVLFDERGGVVSRASRAVDIRFPQPGWVEQDALAVWRTVEDAIDACLASVPGTPVDAVGVRTSVVRARVGTGRLDACSGRSSYGSAAARSPSARSCAAAARAPC